MQKYYLMAPGPSMIPERVRLKMAEEIIHHRTPAFEKVLAKVREQLKELFQTKEEVLLFSSVGSGAMEAALLNCFSSGDAVIAVKSGKFGERWSEQASGLGLKVINIDVPWGEAVDVGQVKNLLKAHPEVRGVLCQACETSTGVAHPIHQLAALVKPLEHTLLLVDAITALGIEPMPMDEWGIDVLLTGSQKALMLPPGLSLMALSAKAWKANAAAKLARSYFDAAAEKKSLVKNQTHFTPAISLIQGLSVALDMIFEEGLEALYARHCRLAEATRQGVQALGLELFAKVPALSVTAVKAPSGIDGQRLVRHLEDVYNVTIIGGQDQLKGKIFRLGHMGYCGDFDILAMLGALEMTLKDLGHSLELGSSVAQAQKVLYEFRKN